jgi:hypothetical protein
MYAEKPYGVQGRFVIPIPETLSIGQPQADGWLSRVPKIAGHLTDTKGFADEDQEKDYRPVHREEDQWFGLPHRRRWRLKGQSRPLLLLIQDLVGASQRRSASSQTRKHDIVDFDEEHTNNQAEFLALLAVLSNALKFAIKSEGQHHVHVASDSQLLISAVTGEKYLHNEELQDLHSQIELIVDSLTHYGVSVDIQWMSDSVVKQHLGH